MKLLDLFCGAGGASVGYHRLGFEVVGVDISPQPNYPFEFHQADALEFDLSGFNAIHASPPCQRYSRMTKRHGSAELHPDLVGPVRELLVQAEVPWVIENVVGAPLRAPVTLCGSSFGLGVRRHRLFETSMQLASPPPPCDHASQGRVIGVYGNPGGSSKRDGITFGGADAWREAMGIDWMVARELRESIPPAYTEWIGENLLLKL